MNELGAESAQQLMARTEYNAMRRTFFVPFHAYNSFENVRDDGNAESGTSGGEETGQTKQQQKKTKYINKN